MRTRTIMDTHTRTYMCSAHSHTCKHKRGCTRALHTCNHTCACIMCMDACTHVHPCACIYTFMCTHMPAHTNACAHTPSDTCMHVHTHTREHTCAHSGRSGRKAEASTGPWALSSSGAHQPHPRTPQPGHGLHCPVQGPPARGSPGAGAADVARPAAAQSPREPCCSMAIVGKWPPLMSLERGAGARESWRCPSCHPEVAEPTAPQGKPPPPTLGLCPPTCTHRGQPGRAGTSDVPEGLVTGPPCGGSNNQVKRRINNSRTQVSAPRPSQAAAGSPREREGAQREGGVPRSPRHTRLLPGRSGGPGGYWHEGPEPCGQDICEN